MLDPALKLTLMDILSPVSATTAAVVLLSLVYYFLKNRNLLPGPKGLPYFGLYPFLTDEKCHLELQEIGEKYGDLYSFTFMGNLIINLGSTKAMRELHVNKSDCFAGRYEDFSILTYTMPDGAGMANGEAWKLLRKFFVQYFKEYGLTVIRDNTAGSLYDSAAQCMDDFRSRKGEPFNIIDALTVRCTRTMRKVLFGDAVSDEKIIKMNEMYAALLGATVGTKLLYIGPFGRFLFKTLPGLRTALEKHKVLQSMLMETVKSIEASLDENHTTCVVEEFYKEKNIRKRKNDSSWRYFTDSALVSSLTQIVGDGVLSVAHFIGCFLYALVEHPEEQDKIHKELMEVVGPDRMPTLEDKSKLPYTNAFIHEVIRTGNFLTIFPSLECTKETTVRGYRIPKGSITMLNFWQAHHDPETYKNPNKFDPSRYIASPGKSRAELPVQFGVGKRACSGEAFAMIQAFLFLTSTVKNFIIAKPEKPTSKSQPFLLSGNPELCFHLRTET